MDKRILIIETEPILARYLGRLIQRVGYNPTVVNSHLQGLKLLISQEYHLIIANLGQYNYNANNLMCELKNRRIGTPVMVVTSSPGLVDQSLPFYAILKKPFQADELLLIVQQILK